MPPPAPIKPQIKPTPMPQTSDCTSRFWALTPCMASLVVMTGRTMNLTPSSIVINTEKLPMVAPGTLLATKLPTIVNTSTAAIITAPFFTSRLPFFL